MCCVSDCFQYGLAERQILELLQGLHVTKTPSHNDRHRSGPSCPEPDEDDGCVRQKAMEKDDICPICQEELLLKKLPVTYCRYIIQKIKRNFTLSKTFTFRKVSILWCVLTADLHSCVWQIHFKLLCANRTHDLGVDIDVIVQVQLWKQHSYFMYEGVGWSSDEAEFTRHAHVSAVQRWLWHFKAVKWRGKVYHYILSDSDTWRCNVVLCVCQVRNSTDVCSYYERECLDKHLGVVCNGCGVCPVVGKCFK